MGNGLFERKTDLILVVKLIGIFIVSVFCPHLRGEELPLRPQGLMIQAVDYDPAKGLANFQISIGRGCGKSEVQFKNFSKNASNGTQEIDLVNMSNNGCKAIEWRWVPLKIADFPGMDSKAKLHVNYLVDGFQKRQSRTKKVFEFHFASWRQFGLDVYGGPEESYSPTIYSRYIAQYVKGALRRDEVHLANCLGKGPIKRKGKLVFEWTISKNGKVLGMPTSKFDDIGDPEIAPCLSAEILTLTFPEQKISEVFHVQFPFGVVPSQ